MVDGLIGAFESGVKIVDGIDVEGVVNGEVVDVVVVENIVEIVFVDVMVKVVMVEVFVASFFVVDLIDEANLSFEGLFSTRKFTPKNSIPFSLKMLLVFSFQQESPDFAIELKLKNFKHAVLSSANSCSRSFAEFRTGCMPTCILTECFSICVEDRPFLLRFRTGNVCICSSDKVISIRPKLFFNNGSNLVHNSLDSFILVY